MDRAIGPLGMEFIHLSTGSFLRGSRPRQGHPNEEPQLECLISTPFALGARPVTQQEWMTLMGTNPAKHTEGWTAGLRPVESISRAMIDAFLVKLNEVAEGPFQAGSFRLPSEAEWEYAARAGTEGRWWFGDDDRDLDAHGWHAGNSGGGPNEVGLKQANPWGFMDMVGNVAEWCADSFHSPHDHRHASQEHVRGSDGMGVLRGGAWYMESDSVRVASRLKVPPDTLSDGFGFRVAWSGSITEEEHQDPGRGP